MFEENKNDIPKPIHIGIYPCHFKMQDSARIKRLIGKALIEENSYSIVKINNTAYTPFKLALRGLQIKPCSSLPLLLRE